MWTSYQQAIEHVDHVFGAQYDDVRERYASEVEQLRQYEESERWWYEYMSRVFEAGFGEDADAYEDAWRRSLQYYERLGY